MSVKSLLATFSLTKSSGARRVFAWGVMALAAAGALWLMLHISGEPVAELRSGVLTRAPGRLASIQRPRADGRSAAVFPGPEDSEEIARLRNAVEGLKRTAYALPGTGAVPSGQVRSEMLRLVQEVSQPSWPGRSQSMLWLRCQWEEAGVANQPWAESIEASRKKMYSEGVRVMMAREFNKMLIDPQTMATASAALRGLSDTFEAEFQRDPALALRINQSRGSKFGIDTGTIATPEEYLAILDATPSAAAVAEADAALNALGLPPTIVDFIEDRVRASIFESGLAYLKPPVQPKVDEGR